MQTGAATGDDDPVDQGQLALAQVEAAEDAGAEGVVQPSPDGVGQGDRLLADLLEHEVLVARLLGGGGVPVDMGHLAGDRHVVDGAQFHVAGGDDGNIVVV